MTELFNNNLISKAKIMVVGCGTLGNEVLKNLALLKVSHLVLIDFDKIEEKNLNTSILFSPQSAEERLSKVQVAAESVKRINPKATIQIIDGDIAYSVGLGLIKQMDIVISCVDNRMARYYINRYCMQMNVSWIDGGVSGLEGSVKAFTPGNSCYSCLLGEREKIEMQARYSCIGVIKKSIEKGYSPTNPIIASIIGAIQVQEALKIISNKKDNTSYPTLEGKILSYDGLNLTFSISSFSAWDEDCCEHEFTGDIEDCNISIEDTVDEALGKINHYFDSGDSTFYLEKSPFISTVIDIRTDKEYPVMVPLHNLEKILETHDELSGVPLGFLRQEECRNIGAKFLWPDLTLKELGIPHNDILCVNSGGEEHFIYVK